MSEQFTMQQYTALCAAIAQGVTKVKYGDKEVSYRSLSEMLLTKSLIEKALKIKKETRRKYIQHTKGLQ